MILHNYSSMSRFRSFIASPDALNRLIVINCGIWLLYKIVCWFFFPVSAFLMQRDAAEFELLLIHWLACPASWQELLLRPWTLLTSLFFHIEFWHLFFNMLMLWFAGKSFGRYCSDKWLWITYFAGGTAGNLCYMAAYNVFPVFASAMPAAIALGASGSIMAILAAGTIYHPQNLIRIFPFPNGFKQIWLLVFFVAIDFLSIPKGNAGGHIAHLGGVLYGCLFILFYMKRPFHTLFHISPTKKRKKEKFYTSYQNAGRPVSDEEYNARKAADAQRLDDILGKISQSGYDALSKEEKDFLFNESRKRNRD